MNKLRKLICLLLVVICMTSSTVPALAYADDSTAATPTKSTTVEDPDLTTSETDDEEDVEIPYIFTMGTLHRLISSAAVMLNAANDQVGSVNHFPVTNLYAKDLFFLLAKWACAREGRKPKTATPPYLQEERLFFVPWESQACSGRVTVICRVSPLDLAWIFPLWAVVMALATDRPIPYPPVRELREVSGR